MITLAEANVKFKSEGADKVKKDSADISNAMSGMAGKIGIATTVADLAVQSIMALGQAIASTSKFAFDQAVQFDSNIRGLAAYSASTQDLRAQVSRLETLAKAPGLGFEQLVQGVTRLEAAGFSAAQAEGALKQFGNALALVGGSKAELDGVSLALTQIKSKGVVSAEEINQIAERVPQVRAAMKAAFGTASTEEIQKLGITASQFVDGVTKEMAKLPRATGGLQNALDNIDEAFKKAGRTAGAGFFALFEKGPNIMGPMLDILQQLATDMNSVFATIADSDLFKSLQQNVKQLIEAFKPFLPYIKDLFAVIGIVITTWLNEITIYLTRGLKFWADVFKDPVKFIKNEFITLGEQIKVIFYNAFAFALNSMRSVTQAIDKITGLKLTDLIPKMEMKQIPVTKTQKMVFDNIMQFAPGVIQKKIAENLGTYFGTTPKVADPLDKIRTGGKTPPGTDDPAKAKDKDDKDKKKKQDKKSESLLALIVQNTSKANELTLRNMTYGGGQLASQGISSVQMSGFRSAKSPQINASNDIVRGVEKLNRSQNMSNNLNFNFRRA
jgi:tape measure domain-containing protein